MKAFPFCANPMTFRSFVMRSPKRCATLGSARLLSSFLAAALFLLTNASFAFAQNQSISGLIAKKETDLLTYEDKLAAYDAEQAVLSQDWSVTGHEWQGPNGAYGTIIAQGSLPQEGGKRHCRRFIHIVHHANDGGANPTFQGVVCRDEGAEWRPR